MRVLLTEVGNASPGDEAITIAAAKKLINIGMNVTVGFRTSLERSFSCASLNVNHLHLPILPIGPKHSTIDSLVSSFKMNQQTAYKKICVAVMACNAVCIAPGGKYLDGFDNALKLITVGIARELGIPYYVLHQSIGPITDLKDQCLIRDALVGAELVVAREDMTYAYLLSLLPTSENVILAGDASWPEDYPKSDMVSFALGINLRWSSIGHSTLEGLQALLHKYRSLNEQPAILIYSTTTSLPADVLALADKYNCVCEQEWSRYPDYLKSVGSCRINISDSMHGVIFSLKAGVPVISLQPDMASWKLKALRGRRGESLNIYSGLGDEQEADVIMNEISHIESSSRYRSDIMKRQSSILERGISHANRGWKAVSEALLSQKNQPPIYGVRLSEE